MNVSFTVVMIEFFLCHCDAAGRAGGVHQVLDGSSALDSFST